MRAKLSLNKAILDQGWAEFRRQLEYKMQWRGGRCMAVPPQYTSQTCPACDHCSTGNRTGQACAYEENADMVGAINILSRGMKMLRGEGLDAAHACAGPQGRSGIACLSERYKPSATANPPPLWFDAALERRRNSRPFRSLSGERQREDGVDLKTESERLHLVHKTVQRDLQAQSAFSK